VPAVAAVPGLAYTSGYLSPDEQGRVLATIDGLPWLDNLRRRVQHYGFRYDYSRRSVDRDLYLGPLPDWAGELAERLRRDRHAPRALDQLIVNEYLPGQGISPHVDCIPCFADAVLSLSIGSPCVMTLSRRDGRDPVDVLLEPGSLLVMRDEARYTWRHAIAARKSDVHEGRRIVRDRRVSLTFRTVLV
jgi:alkylated DNA repair dioxygenase AlkB